MTKICLFGDSITAGYEAGDINTFLTEAIRRKFPQTEVINAGIPGDTTVDALKRLEAHVIAYNPDIVTVFFGANDVAVHNQVSLTTYRSNLHTIVEKIGKEKVILVTTPYADQLTRELDRPIEHIESYTEAALELAQEMQLPVINLLAKMNVGNQPIQYLQEDGLHFSQTGYQLLSREINHEITKMLKRKSDNHE